MSHTWSQFSISWEHQPWLKVTRIQILPRKSNKELLATLKIKTATQPHRSYWTLLLSLKNDYISAENVPDIKDRVKIEMEQVAWKVTCPVSLCSLLIQKASTIQVIFLFHWLAFFNVNIEWPIALNHIRLQNFDSSYLCVLQEKRARVSTTDPMSQGAAEAESPTGKGKWSLGSFFKSKAVPPPSSTTQLEDAIKAELDNYLMTPTTDWEEDPLARWRVHNVDFPWLSKLARKFLCIPATSSPSEKLFNATANVVTCQCSCLKSSKFDMLVFLTRNL